MVVSQHDWTCFIIMKLLFPTTAHPQGLPRRNSLNTSPVQITKLVRTQQRSECVISRNLHGVGDSKTDRYRLMFVLHLIIMYAAAAVIRTYGSWTLPICDCVLSLKSSHLFETNFALWFLWYEDSSFYFLIIFNKSRCSSLLCIMAS